MLDIVSAGGLKVEPSCEKRHLKRPWPEADEGWDNMLH
jgi:hypothetical protein